MDAREGLAAILRDAVLRTAPQDEGLHFFTCSFAGMTSKDEPEELYLLRS
jgi:hypothetical protein